MRLRKTTGRYFAPVQRIHLIGGSGSGKTTLGRLMAVRLDLLYMTRAWRRRHKRYAGLAQEPGLSHAQVRDWVDTL